MREDQVHLLRHFLAALAYRTQKALREAPEEFGDFDPGSGVRTPAEIVRHMASLMGYCCTFIEGGVYRAEPLPSFEEEIERFHEELARFAGLLETSAHSSKLTPEQFLQGPLADAMTHAGQLALLRRMAGSPVTSENFIFADVTTDRLGPVQSPPVAPASKWMGRLIHFAWRTSAFFRRRGG